MSLARRYPQWVLILVTAAVYGPAFLLPALIQPDGTPGMSGVGAYEMAWVFRDYRWLANGFAWLAAAFLAMRVWPWAAAVALAAFGVAVSSSIRSAVLALESHHGPGYWLWTASTGLLTVGSLVGWLNVPRDNRLSLIGAFSGAGGPLRSAVFSGVAVSTAVVWFIPYFDRPSGSREAVGPNGGRISTEKRHLNGVTYDIEWQRMSSSDVGGGGRWAEFMADGRRLRLEDGDLFLDGVEYAGPNLGDRVKLSIDGRLTVNDQPVVPRPPPRHVDPPSVDLPVGVSAVWAFAWTPDGRLVTTNGDRTAAVWDLAKREPAVTLPTGRPPSLFAAAPDGVRIATMSDRGDTVVWNPDGRTSVALPADKRPAGLLAFLTNDWLAEMRGKELVARRIGTEPEVVSLGPVRGNTYSRQAAVSGDGRVVARLEDGDRLAITRVSVSDDRLTVTPGLAFDGYGTEACPVLNRDGTRLFVFRDWRGRPDPDIDRGLLILDTATGRTLTRLRWRHKSGMAMQLVSGAFSPDGKYLALGETESVRVYDLTTGREKAWYGSMTGVSDARPSRVGWAHVVAFSPNGKYLAAGFGESAGPKLRVWEVAAFVGGSDGKPG